jgi:4-aminobutyrate aminotransferase-like enzyme
MGELLKAELNGLMERFDFIGDVRGKGLLLAMELVADRETMQTLPPAKMASARLTELAYERGLILYWRRTRGGYSGDHVLVCPPLIVSEEQIGEIIEPLGDALDALRREL